MTNAKYDQWHMVGLKGTGLYYVYAASEHGRIGVQSLEPERVYRLCFEPSTNLAIAGWKQSDRESRWSLICPSEQQTREWLT